MKQKIFIISMFISAVSIAQTPDNQQLLESFKRLDKIEKKSFKSSHFLNKGFFFGQNLEIFKKFEENPNTHNFTFLSPLQWKSTYLGIKKSGIKEQKNKSYSKVSTLLERYKYQENVVPIGITQAEGEWLENYEIEENIIAKEKGYALSKAYKQFDIFNASVLKKKVYSENVTFEIVPELYDVRAKKRVRSIQIDLSDGKGFRNIKSGDLITTKYTSTGEKAIAVKFILPNKEFISYSVINVVTLKKEEPSHVFNLSLTSSNGRSSSLNGGRALLYNGCDHVFDRPVIIVEGFDPTNNVNIIDKRDNYRDAVVEQSFRSNGYDVIYLDFNDGGADIRDNARVLQELIREVNTQKSGNFPLVIIGESMGGLVARYALTDMESRNQTHNVSHFISFDSPHLGANIPLGFQKLLEDVDDVDIRELFNIRQSDIDEAFTMLNSPAARQMLLRYKGKNPHAKFNTLQNEFNDLGFPQQAGIRNISIINGSANGDRQEPTNNYNPNDIIFKVDWVSLIINGFIKVRTNKINEWGRVSSLWITIGVVPVTIRDRAYNFDAFNYDIASGGFDTNRGAGDFNVGGWGILNIAEWFGSTFNDFGRDHFSFVPLFSSVASTAPRDNQNDLNRSVNQIITNNQTPFDAIYAGNENRKHVDASEIEDQWTDLLQTEFGIPRTVSCQVGYGTNPAALSPRLHANYYYMCTLGRGDFWLANPSDISNLYAHSWLSTGPRNTSGTGDQFTIYSHSPVGVYTITLTRSYTNSSGVVGPSSSSSRLFTVFPTFHPTYGCNEGDDNDGDGLPDPIARVATYSDTTISKTEELSVSAIKIWPNPVKEELHVAYQMLEEGNVSIRLKSLINLNQSEIIITESYRPQGSYQETYYTEYLPNGIYLLILQTSTESVKYKIIINK